MLLAYLGDDLYLPTIYLDSNVQDKHYQPKWKIVESSRLIFPPVVHHWVEHAYPPSETAYVEGLNNENLMNATMVDASRFVSEKNEAGDDLKRLTANLAEDRILQARDIAEKGRVLAHAKTVKEELERKAVAEAQKVRSELSAKMEKFHIDTDFVSQVQERYQGLTVELEEREEQLRKLQQLWDSLIPEKNQLVQSSTITQARLKEAESALDQSNAEVDSLTSRLAGLQGDRNWLITNGLVGAFEYLR
ncbi:hypothetical protein Hanom_Chr11g01011351 [Helianthus anomalus]